VAVVAVVAVAVAVVVVQWLRADRDAEVYLLNLVNLSHFFVVLRDD
jgi:hypothetical protein